MITELKCTSYGDKQAVPKLIPKESKMYFFSIQRCCLQQDGRDMNITRERVYVV
jgi:hypothetical protein